MRHHASTSVLLLTAAAFLTQTSSAQSWSDDLDSYPHGAPVDPGGLGSIGNGWESWSSGLGSSTVAGQPPAPVARSLPNCLSNNPGADTVNNFNRMPSHPVFGPWKIWFFVFAPNEYVGRNYWILLNTYDFGGPYSWSSQVFFDGDLNLVDCDCNNMNDPQGPQQLIRETWIHVHARVDLDADTVDVFYDNILLTGGQGYVWTTGVFGASNGLLEIQALDLFPDVPGHPNTTELYYDDFLMVPEQVSLCVPDPLCMPLANSTGQPALATLSGIGVAGADLIAVVSQGPPGQFGYFISGPNPGLYIVPPGASGIICIGGPQFRYTSVPLMQVFQFDGTGVSHAVVGGGEVILPTDGSYAPVPPVQPGATRAFQAWYRDGPTSNFSDSRLITFT
ncbi:MAG: hypothetical protein GY711_32485 [bacterium]|nr:hypothetical protein [bacterium]